MPLSGQPSYTQNWAQATYDGTWERFLASFAGRPNLNYLEIGVFEGRSLFWMLENILTHSTARATAIDLGALSRPQLLANLAKFPGARKITLIDDLSEAALPKLKPNTFDIIYIDGGHDVRSVMIDAVYSWRLLKHGGLIVFDDYLLGEARFPPALTPKPAVDLFLSGFASEIELLHAGKQVVVKKIESPRKRSHSETGFGPYVYDWYAGHLSKVGKVFPGLQFVKSKIPLSSEEQGALESALRRSANGADTLYGVSTEKDYPILLELGRRLNIPVKEK